MSDELTVSAVEAEELNDEFFSEYSKKLSAENAEKKTNQFTPREYEEIQYAGLESGQFKVFRCIGAPPDAETCGFKRRPFDSKEIYVISVKDDEGKKFTIKVPAPEAEKQFSHILHRLYATITESVYVNKKRVFKHEEKHPELWLAATKTGYKPEDGKSFSFATGLKPTKLIVMNVIDRQDDWCKENKHAKILARSLTYDDKGNTWAEPGVKSYGFTSSIVEIVGKYGNFEKYDLAIKKTGQKERPLDIKNASLFKEKDMMTELLNADGSIVDESIIQLGPLTEDERAYGLYDLDKLFRPTSYSRIIKRIPSVFRLCDACLGTHYYDELRTLAEKEVEEMKRLSEEKSNAEEVVQVQTENAAIKENVVARRVAEEEPVQQVETDFDVSVLKGYGLLTPEQQALIKNVSSNDDNITIEWARDDLKLLKCDCGVPSPESFNNCPACGASFV